MFKQASCRGGRATPSAAPLSLPLQSLLALSFEVSARLACDALSRYYFPLVCPSADSGAGERRAPLGRAVANALWEHGERVEGEGEGGGGTGLGVT